MFNIVHKILLSLSVIIIFSLICVILSEQLVLILVYLDLLVLCIATISIFFSVFYLTSIHYIFGLLLLAIAAIETAIGLGLVVAFYQTTDQRGPEYLNTLSF